MSLPDIPTDPPPSKRRAPSNRTVEYRCTVCGREVGRENLVTKQVRFRFMGNKGADLRTRTVAWLCVLSDDHGGPSCRDLDEAWNAPDRRRPDMVGGADPLPVGPEATAVAPGLTREADRPRLAPPVPAPEVVASQDPPPPPVVIDDPILHAGTDTTPPPEGGPKVIQGW